MQESYRYIHGSNYLINLARSEAMAALAWLYPYQLAEIRATLTHVKPGARTGYARRELSKRHPDEFKRIYSGAREAYAPYRIGPIDQFDKTWEEAKKLLDQGLSHRAVAKKLGVDRAWVSRRYRKEREKK